MDNKNSILLVDPEFDLNTAADCDLLLKITSDSFSYAIIDKSCRQLKAVYDEQECEDIQTTLASKLKNDVYLSLPFNEVRAAVYTANSVYIPNEFYDTALLEHYAKFFPQFNNAYTRTFTHFGFTSIFSLEQFLTDTLEISLKNYRLYHQNDPVLALASQKEKIALFLDFTATSFNAVCTNGTRLIFQNNYCIDNAEEFNYYLILIISQLNVKTSVTEVCLSGIIHDNDDNYKQIEKYFDTISFNLPPLQEIDHKILDDMPAHYYSSLLALDLCE